MTDHDDFDRSLADRLRAAENRVRAGGAPDLAALHTDAPRWRPVALALATVAAAAVAAVVVVPSLSPDLAPGSSVTPERSPLAPASSAPSTTPEPTLDATAAPTDAAPATLLWQPTAPAAPEIRDLVWWDGRFVAVGSADGRAAAWTLIPGSSWEPANPIDPPYVAFDPDANEPGQRFSIATVVELDGELLAFGWRGVGCCDSGGAAVWSSSDGVTWTYQELGGTPFGTAYHSPIDATVNAEGEIVLLSGVALGSESTIWISQDGRAWEEVPPSLAELERMHAIVAGEHGVMAIGAGSGTDGELPRAWTSADGRTWGEVTLPQEATEITALAYEENAGLFVVGGAGSAGAMAWFGDGDAWSQAGLAGPGAHVRDLAARHGIVLGVGDQGEGNDSQLLLWQIDPFGATIAQETILSERAPQVFGLQLELGDGVALVEGSIVESDGATVAGRAWYGVVAVP